jgi:uncharacterized protein YbaR (Trm112 family)
MNCPICNQPMEVWQTKITHDKNGKQFDHKRFVCRKDDVWARLEIPLSLLADEQRQQSTQV